MWTPEIPPAPNPNPKNDLNKSPQELVSEFWDKFIAKNPGKVTTIFPHSLYANILPPLQEKGASSARNAAESYEAAAKQCREQVWRIVRECRRTNEKFADPDFDIESDKNLCLWNCLRGLLRGDGEGSEQDSSSGSSSDDDENVDVPGSVHRIDWIFERPQFTIDGYSNTDIKQGANGDCWWLAAVATICNRQDLMEKICIARDAECGVYGFVFYRDGEWVTTVVDDNLYLNHEDFDYYGDRYDSTGKRARKYKKLYQTGSEALYFAKCSDPNETWLPLLEKAYAKVHGDYESLSGGWSGEAVEDMTGGVTTTIATNRVLNKNKLWKELVNSEKNFVFAASTLGTGWDWTRGGLALGHAYSILRATEEVDEEGNKVRLVLIRNPWGERDRRGIGEWNGPWSDGSREWTPYWLQKLQHRFGDDGIFWMAYEDMLSTFVFLHRTRIFDEKWTVVQRWTSVSVPWVTGYLQTKFLVEIKKAGPVIFVLSQLDKRYFRGLEGQYEFSLHFLLQEENAKPGEHIGLVRPAHSREYRSISAEVELEPGKYEVLPKILATRDSKKKMVEHVVKDLAEENPQKLKQVGMNYDLANAKGVSSEEYPKKNKRDQIEDKAVKDQKENDTKKQNNGKSVLEMEFAPLEILDGFRVNKKGQVLNEDGEPIGELKEGDLMSCTGKKITRGEVRDTDGRIVGQARTLLRPVGKPVDNAPNESTVVKNDEPEDEKKYEATDEKLPGAKDGKEDDTIKKDGDEEVCHPKNESQSSETDDNAPPPWNAICVIGMRVYAKDSEVAIELVKPKDPKDAILDVEGAPM
ncbi:hypothetical protein EYZ11_005112 [Aspergillus tanneri]|uniref:Calpain catalytic domain-containing protein n=1 Tax=Aspergillus tanneri TaxID=1220188 RepID=A0A4S3JJG0_9EURO|nr:hypothetical protein EYZ11_005112 [Aspergillus tanneri]